MGLPRRPPLFLLLLFKAVVVQGDLPVHCLRHQLVGEWQFHLSGLLGERSSCGHQNPDVETEQPKLVEAPEETKQFFLTTPNLVKSSGGEIGSFTMIYDEGWEVRIGNLTFFAFSRFDFVGEPAHNVSVCGETMRGWYRDSSRTKWGCYYAKKQVEATSLISILPPPSPAPPSEDYDRPLTHEWHSRKAKRLNAIHKSWKARVHPQFVGLSMRQLNSLAGIRRSIPREGHRRPTSFLEVQDDDCPELAMSRHPNDVLPHLLLRRPRPCRLRKQRLSQENLVTDQELLHVEASLPKEFSWLNVNGQNFVADVMDQSDCGSCYMVSTMRMLTARHRIRLNDTSAEAWSINFPLFCSEYNQGCKGGYGFLASKWSEDVGLLPESCAPYDTKGECHIQCNLAKFRKRYRASNHRYIGGFYGNSSAAAMMMEVHRNGPVVVSFEPNDDFMMYAGGVFSNPGVGQQTPLDRHNSEWQQVDHAVLLVGWGEEFDQKYWLVQNSWGSSWGDSGFFKIARGENEAGIESIAVAAEVVEDESPEVLERFLQHMVKV